MTRRLARESEGAALASALVDRFGRDMDDNLREMGVGDLTVPKKMKRMFEALYGRTRSYQSALDETGSDALEAALATQRVRRAGRRGGGDSPPMCGARRASSTLRTVGQILAGRLAFPPPRAILAELALTKTAESPPDETT